MTKVITAFHGPWPRRMSEESEKKPPVPAQQQAPPPAPKPPTSPSSTAPPPAAQKAQTPAPQKPPAPAPAPQPQAPRNAGRRGFLKALFAIGAVLSIVPFVPWGRFLSSTASVGVTPTLIEKVVVDDLPQFGAAAGRNVNVNDVSTFPPNGAWQITFPSSGDKTLDAENPDTFHKYELIRLPESMGGGSMKATDFVAFSKVCVHLWCSPNYIATDQKYECPCHGSTYRLPDGLAVAGPAALQEFPTNAIPMLTLQADSSGNLWAVYQNKDPRLTYPNDGVPDTIEANGEVGYGRDHQSYYSFIKPVGEVEADLQGASEEIKS
jgi:rieske iron-sulfur protein